MFEAKDTPRPQSLGGGLAGDSVLTLISEGGHLAYRPIGNLYRNWHLGVEDHPSAGKGKGYRWHPKAGKWAAQVRHQGVQHYLGLFEEEEGARQAVADFRSTHPSWRRRKLSSVRRNHVRSVDEGTLLASRAGIADVVETGVKALMVITTATGKSLSCAAEQAIFTPDGFRLVKELVVGDQLMISAKTVLPSERLIPPSLRAGIGVWTSMQRGRLISERDTCYLCLRIFVQAVQRSQETEEVPGRIGSVDLEGI
jgi:hypothetical protein